MERSVVISKIPTPNIRSLMPKVWEIEPGKLSSELIRRLVVGKRGFLRSVESAQPEPGPVLGQPNLCNPFPPMPLSHPSIELRGF